MLDQRIQPLAHRRLSRLATGILLAGSATATSMIASPANAITRCEAVADAQSWVDNQIPYGHGPGTGCSQPYYCDPLRPGDCYRTDCSGLVSAAWDLPGPGATTYTFATGIWDGGFSHQIDPSQLEPGDALNFGGDYQAGTGHIFLYLSGTWAPGNSVEVIEEYGCGHVAERRIRSYDPKYVPIRLNNIQPCGPPCSNPIGHPVGNAGPLQGLPCSGSIDAPPAPTDCGMLTAGQGLTQGESLKSCNDRFSLALQGDGNVVLYHKGVALWATATFGTSGSVLALQGDGNLVLYTASGCPIWASNTGGHANARLSLQDDGNLVIYDAGGGVLWASASGPISPAPTECGVLHAGQALAPGDSLTSCGGCFTMVMQSDGNLAVYKKDVPEALWSTQTNGKAGYAAEMQGDGNFVLYSNAGCPIWFSDTNGHDGAHLALQDDGHVVVYGPTGAPLWASGMIGCAGGCTCGSPSPPPPPPPPPDAGTTSLDADSPSPGHFDGGTVDEPQADDDGENGDAASPSGQGNNQTKSGGCSCRTGGEAGSSSWLLAVLVLFLLSRRQQRWARWGRL